MKGQLLATIGIDGNDEMSPIPFAICEGEAKDSQLGFLELLLADIGPVRECGWTFTFDQHKACVSFFV